MPSPVETGTSGGVSSSSSGGGGSGGGSGSGSGGGNGGSGPGHAVTVAAAMTPSKSLHLSVCQHSPSTVLMHHSPAEYWKYQVVEWLEQEKLRQLRLGLFWGLSSDSSKNTSYTRRDSK
ncbi:hypothetical protein DFQ27_008004 [Actinomortierella ambigua]|uniref:Uncharacterized protein n=1 Tax=Actinomortierella ambigua TaxID=1343610 RepID=A0A9P6PTR5_9FUNG|nr:hypothetical protein DFQ27_008004 [Actinomortierella ambigua]